MDKDLSKKTKTAEEKFCSECGEIIRLKAEICPKCGVRQLPILGSENSGDPKEKKLGEKFLYSSGCVFIVTIIIVLCTTPQNSWLDGFIGSGMFALFGGCIAMAIPTKRKIVYLPVSLLIVLFLTMVIGLSLNN